MCLQEQTGNHFFIKEPMGDWVCKDCGRTGRIATGDQIAPTSSHTEE